MTEAADKRDDEIEAQFPWYLTGKLPDETARSVERYLAENPAARGRLEAIRRERDGTAEAIGAIPAPDASAGLEKLMASVDALEAEQAETRDPADAASGPLARLGGWLAGLPKPVLAAGGAVAALLIVAQAAVIVMLAAGPAARPGAYEPASGRQASQAAPAQIIVAFRNDSSIGAVMAALEDAGARIVEGPVAGGLYRIRLVEGADDPAAVDRAIERLRARGSVVRFAGPAQ